MTIGKTICKTIFYQITLLDPLLLNVHWCHLLFVWAQTAQRDSHQEATTYTLFLIAPENLIRAFLFFIGIALKLFLIL